MPTDTVTITLEGDGNEPGSLKFVIVTIDDYTPPTYTVCKHRNVSGSLSLALNAAGETLFGSQKDNVNAALAEAIAAAVADAISDAGVDAEVCDNMSICDKIVSGTGSGEHDGVTATADIVIGGDVSCGEANYTGIKWSASVPAIGWDITELLEGIVAANTSNPTAVQAFIDWALSTGNVVAELSGSDWVLTDGTVSIVLPGGTPDPIPVGITYASGVGNYYTDPDISDQEDPTVLTLDSGPSPNPYPASVTIRYVDKRKLPTEFIPLNGSSPPDYSPGAESAHGVASGTITVAYGDEYQKLVDPGTPHTLCRRHWTYISRYPIQANDGCIVMMYLLKDALHRDAPGVYGPPCFPLIAKNLTPP